ncbi:DNA polymerase III subunit epsilon [Croceicoccus naphthovorans]|uniref:DNA polymerase III subunit epsilon n=1 Tax=Croceicoccus naphthovorans TaxID=1348774 RepID=A0A0G3XI27_9SPHN|nr:DNA polymerase III subunit epsilon [Croceicoccus naphthovorans]AKM11210.1 DNA polymerase III subunit epsilon [Croceicoccus naphthovorans]MBB3989891.1 DNA polymerase-3 subunit epsilon [Croceicoccus naphthovorans]
MREIVFDTETTGLDPRTGDRMVEIGCIEMVNRVATGQVFHAYFNPDRDMPEEAERVHGLSAAFLSDKPRFVEKVADLLAFIGDSPLVAHNAGFDFNFLNAELALCEMEAVCLTRMVDTVQIAKKKHPGAKLSLDALCTRYGVDRSHRTKHGALLDAELLAQVYVELTGGRQIGLELAVDNSAAPIAIETEVVVATAGREFRPARPHAASAEEIQRHEAFIATLKDPIWARGAA